MELKRQSISITLDDLKLSAAEGLLSAHGADALWARLEQRCSAAARFDLANLTYFFGALITIAATVFLVPAAWERFGGGGLLLIAAIYAGLFTVAGRKLWFQAKRKVPGGLFFTMAVCMAPLAIYGLERMTGLWPQGAPTAFANYSLMIKGSWILMEIGTVLAGLVALRFVRFPFLTAPIAFSLWFMSMDLAPLVLGWLPYTPNQTYWVTTGFGLAMIAASRAVDRKAGEDYSWWGYLFGCLGFWGGLSALILIHSHQPQWLVFAVINLAALVVSVLIQRRVFAVFGGLGIFAYLVQLTATIFKDSILFPFLLCAMGLLVIVLGVQYQRRSESTGRRLSGFFGIGGWSQ